MGRGKVPLIVVRVLALVCALGVVGVGAWSKFIIHDVEIRGTAIIELVRPAQGSEQYWRDYFTTVLNGVTRIWISIAAASFASLSSIFIVLATVLDRMRISCSVLVPMEGLSMCAMATAFGTSLSFALNVDTFSQRRLETFGSSDLALFSMLVPLSKAYVVAAGTAWFLILVACITSGIQACNRARAKESCSFEPTASALGMAHGYQAVVPSTPSDRVPTMYDPRRPLRVDKQGPGIQNEEEQSLGKEGGQMGRRDSGMSDMGRHSVELEKEITGPLGLESPQKVAQIRPSRPWSEGPKKASNLHAM